MKSGFELKEAQEMLGLAYAADLLGPAGFKKEEVKNWKKNYSQDLSNPLFNDDGTKFPYPDQQVWPEGWTAALAAKKGDSSPWDQSVIVPQPFRGGLEAIIRSILRTESKEGSWRSLLSDKLTAQLAKQFDFMWLGANNAVITFNEKRNAYAISFAGTQNQLGQFQDLIIAPVSAKVLSFGPFKSNTSYIYNVEEKEGPNENEEIGCYMHLGFRLALEQFTVNAASEDSLIEVLIQLNAFPQGKDENGKLNLYISGHSLGAALGSIFTAWLQANEKKLRIQYERFPKLNLKMYVFATPKTGNEGFSKSFNMGLSNQALAFHIDNHLDAVPEIPLSTQTFYSLGNLEMLTSMGNKLDIEEEELSDRDTEKEIERLEKLDSPTSRSKIMSLIKRKMISAANSTISKANWVSRGPFKDNNYQHLGQQIILRGSFPKIRSSAIVDKEYYPGDGIAKPTDMAPPQIVASWWQHWPWVYRKALDEMFDPKIN